MVSTNIKPGPEHPRCTRHRTAGVHVVPKESIARLIVESEFLEDDRTHRFVSSDSPAVWRAHKLAARSATSIASG
jgi:hypothetical protein